MKFDERKLYQGILKGNEKSLKELMNHYKESFNAWASITFNGLNHNDYEDAFAEATIQFYEKVTREQFKYRNLAYLLDNDEISGEMDTNEAFQHSTIKTYLFHLAKNRLLNEINKKKVRSKHQENVSIYIKNTQPNSRNEESLILQERREIVSKLLNKLPPNYRQILVLFFFKNYSMEAIARELNLSNENVAKTTKYKAVKALQKIVKPFYKLDDFSLEK